ncbi:hypothetical protein [Photobacterium sp. 53610]|uniref:hypothetical protein n=1 Tax=Photobacterium sp. 53610 TaxID=3102789 RepID=UPI002ED891F6
MEKPKQPSHNQTAIMNVPRRQFLISTVGIVCLGFSFLTSFPVISSESLQKSQSIINWDDGRLIYLQESQTATCSSLLKNHIYCVVVYNASENDNDIELTVTWSNQYQPEIFTIPGTTERQGNASLIIVSGDDTSTLSISLSQGNGEPLECWLVSTEMPKNLTQLSKTELPADGKMYPLPKRKIYNAQTSQNWYQLTLENVQTQSVIAQIQQQKIVLYIVNPVEHPNVNILALGTVKSGDQYVIQMPPSDEQPQRLETFVQGDGEQLVWLGVSSQQDLENAKISLQTL